MALTAWGVDGVHGDRNDHGDAHASATFHEPLFAALALHWPCCPRCQKPSTPRCLVDTAHTYYLVPTCTAQLHRSARPPPTTDHRPLAALLPSRSRNRCSCSISRQYTDTFHTARTAPPSNTQHRDSSLIALHTCRRGQYMTAAGCAYIF